LQVFVQHDKRLDHGIDDTFGKHLRQLGCGKFDLFGLAVRGDVGEGQHHAINDVFEGAVGFHACHVPNSVVGLHFALAWNQGFQHDAQLAQQVLTLQIQGNVTQRMAHIAGDQA
jgi:hypothetical protein